MKNGEIDIGSARLDGHGRIAGLHERSRLQPLQVGDDDPLARPESLGHDAHAVEELAELNLAVDRSIIGSEDKDEPAALVGADRGFGDQNDGLAVRLSEADPSELAGCEQAVLSTAEQKSAIRRRKTRPSCYMPGGVA
jgi:hypothetical protein